MRMRQASPIDNEFIKNPHDQWSTRKTDAEGKAFRDEIVKKALNKGTGWEDYIYTSPRQSGLYFRTTYYQLATGSDGGRYIVCAGKFKDRP